MALPISQEHIKKTIYTWLVAVFAKHSLTLVVCWEDQNEPRPSEPYLSLKIGGLEGVGEDFVTMSNDAGEIFFIGNREFVLAMQYHGRYPLEKMEIIKSSINLQLTQELLSNNGIVFVDAMTAHDLTDLNNSRFEPRAVMDILMRTASVSGEEVGFIESVEIEGKFYNAKNELKYTEQITVP